MPNSWGLLSTTFPQFRPGRQQRVLRPNNPNRISSTEEVVVAALLANELVCAAFSHQPLPMNVGEIGGISGSENPREEVNVPMQNNSAV